MNLASIIVAAVVAIAFVSIIVSAAVKKKQGKSLCSCGSSCAGCAMKGACHANKD